MLQTVLVLLAIFLRDYPHCPRTCSVVLHTVVSFTCSEVRPSARIVPAARSAKELHHFQITNVIRKGHRSGM